MGERLELCGFALGRPLTTEERAELLLKTRSADMVLEEHGFIPLHKVNFGHYAQSTIPRVARWMKQYFPRRLYRMLANAYIFLARQYRRAPTLKANALP